MEMEGIIQPIITGSTENAIEKNDFYKVTWTNYSRFQL